MFQLRATMFVVAASLVLSSQARAQASQQPDAPTSTEAVLAPPGSASSTEPAARTLTSDQIETFAKMVDAPATEVAKRLESDAAIRGEALGALEARQSRRGTGKALTIIGFSILVVGDIVGTVIIVTTPGYPTVASDQTDRVLVGLGVGLVAVGVGLALAIPGIVKLARPGDVERRAIADFKQPRPSVLDSPLTLRLSPSFASRSLRPPPALTLPVVSLAF
jgi:hypothetical protein